jgi:hypothetical protein
MAIHICCKSLFKMFHLLQTYVASVLSECCICCSAIHMLQAYVSNVLSASDICCRKCFHVVSVSWVGASGPCRRRRFLCAWYGCCKSRFGCCICCNGYTHILQVSTQNVSSTSDICCKIFYLEAAYVGVAIHIHSTSLVRCYVDYILFCCPTNIATSNYGHCMEMKRMYTRDCLRLRLLTKHLQHESIFCNIRLKH